jgi:hypothetical protein
MDFIIILLNIIKMSDKRSGSKNENSDKTPLITDSKIKAVQDQVTDVKNAMLKNFDLALIKTGKLEDLEAGAKELAASATVFDSHAKDVRRQMWRKNVCMWAIIVSVVLVVIGLIILFALHPWDHQTNP